MKTTGPDFSSIVTDWQLLEKAKNPLETDHQESLDRFMKSYLDPIYTYIRRRGYQQVDAEDLTQQFFFTFCQALGKAKHDRGQFRFYLFTSLQNFLRNSGRGKGPKVLSLERTSSDEHVLFEPIDRTKTPQEAFDRELDLQLLKAAFDSLHKEFFDKGLEVHFDLFRIYLFEPLLTGAKCPSQKELADKYGIPQKQISNRLITARRAYSRILLQQLAFPGCSKEEIVLELKDLFRRLSRK